MGRLYHFEIPAKDIPAATEFYSKVLTGKWINGMDRRLLLDFYGPDSEGRDQRRFLTAQVKAQRVIKYCGRGQIWRQPCGK